MINEKPIRPSYKNYFMNICKEVSTRSTCLRHHVGAILIKNKRILSTGYNGAPAGLPHCIDIGCPRKDVPSGTMHELCRAVHAEQNAIIQAAMHGISIEGATLYCTHQPCILCSKMIINAGIVEVIYEEEYEEKSGLEMLKQAGIKTVKYNRYEDIDEINVDNPGSHKYLQDYSPPKTQPHTHIYSPIQPRSRISRLYQLDASRTEHAARKWHVAYLREKLENVTMATRIKELENSLIEERAELLCDCPDGIIDWREYRDDARRQLIEEGKIIEGF